MLQLLLIGYLWLYLYRPFEIWPVLGTVRLELVYGGIVAICWLFTSNKQWPRYHLHYYSVAFLVCVSLSWLLSPFNHLDSRGFTDFLKLWPCYFLLVTVVGEHKSFRLVLLAYLGVMALYMIHSLVEYGNGRHVYRMGLVRLIGVNQALSDPNYLAASIVYMLPWIMPIWTGSRSLLGKTSLTGLVIISIVCIALTGSRSGLLGLIVVMVLGLLRMKHKLVPCIALVMVALVFWMLLPSSLQTRFASIVNPDIGPLSAKISAEGRLQGFWLGLNLFIRYPLTGCGPGYWMAATGRQLQPHNLYGQLLGETGVLGTLSFLGLLAALVTGYFQHKQQLAGMPPVPECQFSREINYALFSTVILLLFLGNFSHSLFRYHWVWCAAFGVIIHHCVQITCCTRRDPHNNYGVCDSSTSLFPLAA